MVHEHREAACASARLNAVRSERSGGADGGFGAASSAVGVAVGGRAAAGAESALFFAEDAVVIGVHPVEDGARAVVGGVAAHRLRLLRVAFAHHLVDGLQHSTQPQQSKFANFFCYSPMYFSV